MRRILISGLALLLGAVILVCNARSKPAAPGKPSVRGKGNPLVFVFVRVDAEQSLAILRPMIAPDIGVQVDAGSPKLEKHGVLQCQASMREHEALVEGQPGKITETLLICGDRKFVVKALDFSPLR